MIQSLGYIGLNAPDLDEWERVAGEGFGVMAVRRDDGLQLRLDERAYRLRVHRSDAPGFAYAGWEVAHAQALGALVARLEGASVPIKEMSAEECADRAVIAGVAFADDNGYEHHAFYGAAVSSSPFRSPTGTQFVTGHQGAGHIVLLAPDHVRSTQFLSDVLGFRLSDQIAFGPVRLSFFHCNRRHHSVAVMTLAAGDRPHPRGIHHFMLEVADVDMLGLAYDRCRAGAAPLASTLGRHTNDQMISFYARTPSAVEVEYGWAGRPVDTDPWVVTTYDRPSTWGHHRDNL
jgi:2,3-dihydroxybiphenyl 1,2-dioxygenase